MTSTILIKALATFGAAYVLAYSNGPFHILAWWRDFIGLRVDEYGFIHANNVLAELWQCPICLSFWIGLFLSGGNVLEALAYMGVTIILVRLYVVKE